MPLTEKICVCSNTTFTLNDLELQAFNNVKNKISEFPSLAHQRSEYTEYQLITDSSNYPISAALHQVVEGTPIPIGFFSKKLAQTQTKYSTFDKEPFAAYSATLYLKHIIEGKQVLLLTDHKPLCGAFRSLNPAKSDRIANCRCCLTEYISDIGYIKGYQNVIADCLSRPTLAVTVDLCYLPAIVAAQIKKPELKEFQKLKKKKSEFGQVTVNYQDHTVCLLFTPQKIGMGM